MKLSENTGGMIFFSKKNIGLGSIAEKIKSISRSRTFAPNEDDLGARWEMRVERNNIFDSLMWFDQASTNCGGYDSSFRKKIHSWISSGGKVFVVAETPYLKNFSPFIPIFEKRKKEGMELPGFVEDVMEVDPIRGRSLPKQMMVFDKDVLSSLFKNAGLIVEQCEEFARPEFPKDLQLDGRESVGLIARKP